MMRDLNDYFDSKIEVPLIRYGKRQRIETLINEARARIDYDGTLYDCDFNLANKMPLKDKPNIKDFDLDLKSLNYREIITGNHCYGCTAGEGSSCGGALVQ